MYVPKLTQTERVARMSGRQALRTAAVAFALLLGACGQSQLSEEEYLQNGRQAFLNGDIRTSSIHLKNLLQINPKNAEARFLLGQIYLGTGDMNAALLELERARELGFSETALMVPMGRANLLSGQYGAVLEQPIESEALAVSDRAYLYSLRGYAYIGVKDAVQAQSAFDRALTLQPNLEFALLGQIRLALAQGDLKAAGDRSGTALRLNPESPEVNLLVGEIASLRGDGKAADAAFTKTLELEPGNVDALSRRAMIRIATKSMNGAREDIDQLRRLAPAHPKTLYVGGLYHYKLEQYVEAQDVLEQLISKQPDHDRGMYLLGVTNLALLNDEQGLRYLEQFITRNPGSLEASNQLVIVYLRRGEQERARRLLDAAMRLHPRDARLLPLLALFSLAEGKPSEAVEYLRRAEQLNPDVGELQLVVGLSLMQADDPQGAIEALSKAAASGVDTKLAENVRVLAYLKAGENAQALAAALDLVAKNPDSSVEQKLLGYVYYKDGQMENAKAAYETALRLVPGDPDASHNLALVSQSGGSYARARALYEEVLDHNPYHVATLVRLGLLEQSMGSGAEAGVGHFRKALELSEESVDARLALARYFLVSGSSDEAIALLRDAPARVQFRPGILALLAEAQAASGETRLAAEALHELTSRYPTLAAPWLQLGLLQMSMGERDAAADSFIQAMRHRPKDALFGASVARGLHLTGRTEQAKALLRDLRSESPNDLNVRLLQGWFDQQAGEYGEALKVYRAIHEEHPSKASALALASGYAKSGQIGEGIRVLRQWLEQNPNDKKASIALAQLQINTNRSDEAVETLSRVLVHRPDDVGLLNDVALLLRRKNPVKALEFARRAHTLAPELPTVMDTYGVLLLDAGQVQQSVQLLTRAVAKEPDSPAMRLHLAQALVADGAPLRGRAELDRLLVRHPEAPERAEAKAMLDQLSER